MDEGVTACVRYGYDEARGCFVYEVDEGGGWHEVDRGGYLGFQATHAGVIHHNPEG